MATVWEAWRAELLSIGVTSAHTPSARMRIRLSNHIALKDALFAPVIGAMMSWLAGSWWLLLIIPALLASNGATLLLNHRSAHAAARWLSIGGGSAGSRWRSAPAATLRFDWVNAQVASDDFNPIYVAARAQMWFVSIHPFTDGNGRTARLLTDCILGKGGLPPALMGNRQLAVFGAKQFFDTGSDDPLGEAIAKIEEALADTLTALGR